MNALRERITFGVNCTCDASSRLPATTWAAGITSPPVGSFVTPAASTTDVGTDVAFELPYAFFAVTSTRIVRPTSADPSLLLEPETVAAQLLPAPSQRSHR